MSNLEINYDISRYKGSSRIGKWFEKEVVEPLLGDLEKGKLAFQHRFVDSGEAGNVVRGQPSDYLLSLNGISYLIEAKASEKAVHFRPSTLRPSQISGLYRWSRAGNPSLILFYSHLTGEVQIWDGGAVAADMKNGNKLNKDNLLARKLPEELYNYLTLEIHL